MRAAYHDPILLTKHLPANRRRIPPTMERARLAAASTASTPSDIQKGTATTCGKTKALSRSVAACPLLQVLPHRPAAPEVECGAGEPRVGHDRVALVNQRLLLVRVPIERHV
jgi:hypothetical protein